MARVYSLDPQLQQQIEIAHQGLLAHGLLTLSGPSGAGKSHLAVWLAGVERHTIVALAGLSEARFESELFGHVKGAFSGAHRDHGGLLGATAAGTLILEGLEDLTHGCQAALLRFLQTRQYRPVGAVQERTFSGRLVFTSRLSLTDLLSAGRLREDFYYRLAASECALPDAVGRSVDFVDVALALVAELTEQLPDFARRPSKAELADLQDKMPEGGWHGLRNLLQQSMLRAVSPQVILNAMSPSKPALDLPDTGSLKSDLLALEKRLLSRALDRHQGLRRELAVDLGISERSLAYKLKKHFGTDHE